MNDLKSRIEDVEFVIRGIGFNMIDTDDEDNINRQMLERAQIAIRDAMLSDWNMAISGGGSYGHGYTRTFTIPVNNTDVVRAHRAIRDIMANYRQEIEFNNDNGEVHFNIPITPTDNGFNQAHFGYTDPTWQSGEWYPTKESQPEEETLQTINGFLLQKII